MPINTPIITVINCDKSDKRNLKYYKTAIKNVWWYGGTLKMPQDKTFTSAEIYKISVYDTSECDRTYLPEQDWITGGAKDKFWTLQLGDLVVKGDVSEGILTAEDYRKILTNYQDIASITGFKDLRFGGLPYIRIEGGR